MDEHIRIWLRIARCFSLSSFKAKFYQVTGVDHPLELPPTILDQMLLTHAELFNKKIEIGTDLEWINHSDDHYFISIADNRYPDLLKQIPDPPLGLFIKGRFEYLSKPAIAIVGSRNPSPQGQDTARQFASQLSQTGFTVISGLAYGIDACAHRGALMAKGGTISICATGLDQVYPRSHTKLADDICQRGLMISEFPTNTPPLRHHFPRRNRIISGLSLGVLVVEAGIKSGSLITARLAAEQGREVYAIPSSIRSPLSKGCHKLLKDGAKLVESMQDIFVELEHYEIFELPQTPVEVESRTDILCEKDLKLLHFMGYEANHKDELIIRSGLTASEVSSMLLQLELSGHVELCPDGTYLRKTKT